MRPAFFQETIKFHGRSLNLTQRASRVLAAVQIQEVVAFAPEILRYEFTNSVRDRLWKNEHNKVDQDEIDAQVRDFFRLPVTYVPGDRLAEHAWRYMTELDVSPPDSWYLACAVVCDAELWISHDHADRLTELISTAICEASMPMAGPSSKGTETVAPNMVSTC